MQDEPTEYADIVKEYIQQYRSNIQEQLAWFREQPTLEAAIERAALSVNRCGKRFSHQYRIRNAALLQAKCVLLTAKADLCACQDFDKLIEVIGEELSHISGLGELYVYDTALRIGAKLGLLPQKVYLHRGARAGAQALGLNAKARTLEVEVMPPIMQKLTAHELEDVLCIFKGEFITRPNLRLRRTGRAKPCT